MSLSTPFIYRPVGTALLTVALGLAGGIAYRFLPTSPLPQVEFPTISVGAGLPGASPETMASSVATPLERQFGRIAAVTEMTSTSSLGSTGITLQFDLNRSIDAAARDVQASINAARGQLPANLPNNPSYRKINPADAPILILCLTSDLVGKGKMYDVGSSILAQRLAQVEGVGQVFVGGSSLPAVRVEVNPTMLNSFGLNIQDVHTALAAMNANRPKGEFMGKEQSLSISTTDQLFKASEYQPLVIAYSAKTGGSVRLSDIAKVTDSVENVFTGGSVDGKPSVVLVIFRQPGANMIDTVDRVRALLPSFQAQIPPTIRLGVALDRTTTIRASVHDVQVSLLISVSLVIMVVFIFLRSFRSTLIPGVAVPISLIGTFGVMYLCNYSLDNLSLMALTIATGFVVDDAIVVIENITRHLEAGMSPFPAALLGAKEIGFTVLSMSLSLVAVFIPILLMGGIVGRLFREFAVVLSTAIGVSLLVSLTTTPMMCAHLLKTKRPDERHNWFYRVSEKVFNLNLAGYSRSLTWVLRHQPLTLAVAIATVGLSVYLFITIPKGFFPQQDVGRLQGMVIADQSISFQSMSKKMEQIIGIVLTDPDVDGATTFYGGQGTTNNGRMFITLRPLGQRKTDIDHVIGRLRPRLGRVPGATLFLQAVQDVRIGGRMGGAQYQYTLQGDDFVELVKWAPLVTAKLKTLYGLADVNSDQQDKGLQASVVIDRNTASRLGITAKQIDATLYDAFGQSQVSTMYSQINQYHVVMNVLSDFWQNPEGLDQIYLTTNQGTQAPLGAFTRYAPSTTPLSINHSGQFPSVTISFNLAPGFPLGTAVEEIADAQREMGLPAAIHGSFSGAAQAYQASLANEPILILAALIAVYIVLGILYESFIHPVTILSTLPSAGVGALLALKLTNTDLSVIALIGIILLIGIVKKNAIMMIDFALETERKGGKSPEEAIYEACVLRFRPITMTTMAALLGGLPLAMGLGNGAELRRPLGITIVGGLIFSQMLTLYTTPVVYIYMDRLRLWATGAKRSASAERPAPMEMKVVRPRGGSVSGEDCGTEAPRRLSLAPTTRSRLSLSRATEGSGHSAMLHADRSLSFRWVICAAFCPGSWRRTVRSIAVVDADPETAPLVGRTFMLDRFNRVAARWPACVLLALVGLATGACTVGPKYQRPSPPPLPTAYKEAPPAGFGDVAGWKEAQPNDGVLRGKWWEAFKDPLLNSLEEQVDVSNQNLKQSEAQYRSALAAIRVTRAGLFPTVTGGATVTGAQSSSNLGTGFKSSPAANLQLPVQFSYEADVWGRVRSALEGNVASAQATAADLETARLSAHALLAQSYLQLRGLDTQHDLLQDTVAAYQKALELTTNRYKQGIVSKLDVVQAQTQIENTKTQLIDTGVLRAQYEHAIAALLGKTPADLSIGPALITSQPPVIPGVLPAALLERRPDIAGAERRAAAANAQIGVAKAAFYPAIGFNASAGFQGSSLLNWFTWPSRFWSLGPTLAQTLFEAGGRKAVSEQALAAFDGTAATYRQTVLIAFQEVEDNLSALRILEQESQQQQLAVNSAALSTELSLNQYKGGITTYLTVITAQAIELGDRVTAVNLLTRRMVASVGLIQALGGGWDTTQLPASNDLLPPGKGFFSKAFPKALDTMPIPASSPKQN